jgi:folate-binding protein YgfZ
MHVDTTRAILAIGGEQRSEFLQGLLTQDLTLLRADRGAFAALLSPQGKILHTLFLLPHGDTIFVDCVAAEKDLLLKRLTMYKLRAKVSIADASAQWQVAYRIRAQHPAIGHLTTKKHLLVLTDPRAAELGERLYIEADAFRPQGTVDMASYRAHRIRLGIPAATDLHDETAIDAGLDALNGVSFSKGCYVGQEVTARMHYKQINRRGFFVVEGAQALPAEAALLAHGETLGTLRSAEGTHALALLKFEQAEPCLNGLRTASVDNQPVRLHVPAWLQPKLAQFRALHENQ